MIEGEFTIVSLNVSERKGTRKHPVNEIYLVPALGVQGDAHAGQLPDRQVSLLAIEDIEIANKNLAQRCVSQGTCTKVVQSRLLPGDFAENITTQGVKLHDLPIGTKLFIGECELEVTRIGKECHAACEIRTLVGDCIMPRRGIFARVLRGGRIGLEDRGHYCF